MSPMQEDKPQKMLFICRLWRWKERMDFWYNPTISSCILNVLFDCLCLTMVAETFKTDFAFAHLTSLHWGREIFFFF